MITPHLISVVMTPFALCSVAYPLLAVAGWRLVAVAPGVIATALRGSRNDSKGFGEREVLLLIASCLVASVIRNTLPAAEWWSSGLTSKWEVAFGIATVMAAAAGVLLTVAYAALATIAVLALLVWLNEPAPDNPGALPRVRVGQRAAVAKWRAIQASRRPSDGRGPA